MELTLKQKTAFGIGAVGKDMVYALSAAFIAGSILSIRIDWKIAVQHRIDGRGVMTPFRATVSVTFENPFRMVDIARSAVGYAQFSV